MRNPGPSPTLSGMAAPPPGYRPLDGPALLVKVLLGVFTLVTLVAVVSDLLEATTLSRQLHDPAGLVQAQAVASDSRQALLASLQLAAYLVTAVAFLVWFHRAYANLPALGIEPLPFAPGWTVGAWLVPVLNLIRPKQIMDAIWRGSDPGRPRYDPFWCTGSVRILVHLWWAVFVVSWLVDRTTAVLLGEESTTTGVLRAGSIGTLAADVLDLVLVGLCFELVRQATRRQQSRAARLAIVPPA
jgi:hypothetical protein